MLFETPQQVNLSDSVKNIQTSTGNKGAFLVHKKHICLGLMLFTVCSSYHCLPCGFWFMTKKQAVFQICHDIYGFGFSLPTSFMFG